MYFIEEVPEQDRYLPTARKAAPKAAKKEKTEIKNVKPVEKK